MSSTNAPYRTDAYSSIASAAPTFTRSRLPARATGASTLENRLKRRWVFDFSRSYGQSGFADRRSPPAKQEAEPPLPPLCRHFSASCALRREASCAPRRTEPVFPRQLHARRGKCSTQSGNRRWAASDRSANRPQPVFEDTRSGSGRRRLPPGALSKITVAPDRRRSGREGHDSGRRDSLVVCAIFVETETKRWSAVKTFVAPEQVAGPSPVLAEFDRNRSTGLYVDGATARGFRLPNKAKVDKGKPGFDAAANALDRYAFRRGQPPMPRRQRRSGQARRALRCRPHGLHTRFLRGASTRAT